MRQTKNFTCGAKALENLLYISGEIESISSSKEFEISDKCNGKPFVGIDNDELVRYVLGDDFLSSHLIDYGENTYKGGVAIFNIRNWRSGIGHYVVCLGYEDNFYKILDSIDGSVHLVHKDKLLFENSDGSLKKWSINFDINADIFKDRLENGFPPIIFIIKGEKDVSNKLYDTVIFLEEMILEENKNVSVVNENDIYVFKNSLYLNGVKVHKKDKIFIKIDPSEDIDYFVVLRILSMFEDELFFINKPSLILKYDDKMLPYYALKNDYEMNIFRAKKGDNVFNFLKSDHVMVSKELGSFGGNGIRFSDEDINERTNNKFCIFQESVLEKENRDLRIFWYDGEYRGITERKTSKRLCNMTQGNIDIISYKFSLDIFSEDMQKKLILISNFLKKEGFVIAGVDVLNNKIISEVNISNVSVFKNYIEQTGDNFILPTLFPNKD